MESRATRLPSLRRAPSSDLPGHARPLNSLSFHSSPPPRRRVPSRRAAPKKSWRFPRPSRTLNSPVELGRSQRLSSLTPTCSSWPPCGPSLRSSSCTGTAQALARVRVVPTRAVLEREVLSARAAAQRRRQCGSVTQREAAATRRVLGVRAGHAGAPRRGALHRLRCPTVNAPRSRTPGSARAAYPRERLQLPPWQSSGQGRAPRRRTRATAPSPLKRARIRCWVP